MRTPLLSLAPLLFCGPASAQDICDHITVESIAYAPFGNGLEVVVHNGNDDFLSYPMVQVVDAEGDTIGGSALFFFGIGGHSSLLHHVPTAGNVPASPFTGTVLFHYIGIDSSGTCAIPITEALLCPTVPSIPLEVYTYFNTNATPTELTWAITDTNGDTVSEETLVVDPTGSGSDADQLQLPPGHYTLHVAQTSTPLFEFPILFSSPDMSYGSFIEGNLDAGGHLMLPFSLFEPCIAIGQAVDEFEPSAPLIRMMDQQLHIRTMDGSPLGAMQIMDAIGRSVKQVSSNGSASAAIDLTQHAAGTYMVRSLDPQQPWKAQRFLLP